MITDAVPEPGAFGPDEASKVIDRLRVENAHLRRKLETAPVIEQAKGILMHHYGVDADTAFQILCRWSQDTNTKLSRIAEILTAGDPNRPARPADDGPLAPTPSLCSIADANNPFR